MRPKSHRPGSGGLSLTSSATGGIVAASTDPTLMSRRNATQLSVHRRRATRRALASAIAIVMASPGRNHGRTSASALKGSPAGVDENRSSLTSPPASLPEEYRPAMGLSGAAWPGDHLDRHSSRRNRQICPLLQADNPLWPSWPGPNRASAPQGSHPIAPSRFSSPNAADDAHNEYCADQADAPRPLPVDGGTRKGFAGNCDCERCQVPA
jgi:hypothetical protein